MTQSVYNWRDRPELMRVCLATKLASTAVQCQHGYTWQCPNAADIIAYLVEVRHRNLGVESGCRIVGEIEKLLPWLRDRRSGRDRRQA